MEALSLKKEAWVFPIIIGGIGVLYLIYNAGAIIETKKIQAKGSDHHISGIPFLGGIHLLIAGLISPIKWLALFCVLDYTLWSFLYAVFIGDCFKKNDEQSGIFLNYPLYVQTIAIAQTLLRNADKNLQHNILFSPRYPSQLTNH